MTTDNLPMSTYYVAPCQDLKGNPGFRYFDNEYHPVKANALNCATSKGDVDFLCLEALPPGSVISLPPGHTLMGNATLLAAIVRTIGKDDCLPNTYLANDRQQLVLPVLPLTTRAAVLIFSLSNNDGVTGLIATQDPEIKNGTVSGGGSG